MTRTRCQIENFRKGTALIQVQDRRGRVCAGIHVSVEQETHKFVFGCVVPDLNVFSERDRHRYNLRLQDVFNQVWRAPQQPIAIAGPNTVFVDATNCGGKRNRMHLGVLRSDLDRLASGGNELGVYVSGQTVGMSLESESKSETSTEREMGYRVADLYTLCFSHPSVRGILWKGFSDGEATGSPTTTGVQAGGLLRQDLSPKHAHKVLRKLIGTIWHSREQGETDKQGLFRFRGFFGNYRVVVAAGTARTKMTTLSLSDRTDRSTPLIVEISVSRRA